MGQTPSSLLGVSRQKTQRVGNGTPGLNPAAPGWGRGDNDSSFGVSFSVPDSLVTDRLKSISIFKKTSLAGQSFSPCHAAGDPAIKL